ncbi:hypothetical protein SPBR_06373 [Sporothrix brasiliensis 5110]|uniref:Myb-like domain-containing protein n=1 Tax=Sporothrix brasiliensis 5110 TaxID=1398154 RepID=A0A0C2IWD3_9PEZI|nr:uncharacterized protein SPBR_06373 [Sporothrix brasiliensis 5110]KIH89302.1 hypothetical protein SPBR_06373 [Sporothrix brasiliensis 5110]
MQSQYCRIRGEAFCHCDPRPMPVQQHQSHGGQPHRDHVVMHHRRFHQEQEKELELELEQQKKQEQKCHKETDTSVVHPRAVHRAVGHTSVLPRHGDSAALPPAHVSGDEMVHSLSCSHSTQPVSSSRSFSCAARPAGLPAPPAPCRPVYTLQPPPQHHQVTRTRPTQTSCPSVASRLSPPRQGDHHTMSPSSAMPPSAHHGHHCLCLLPLVDSEDDNNSQATGATTYGTLANSSRFAQWLDESVHVRGRVGRHDMAHLEEHSPNRTISLPPSPSSGRSMELSSTPDRSMLIHVDPSSRKSFDNTFEATQIGPQQLTKEPDVSDTQQARMNNMNAGLDVNMDVQYVQAVHQSVQQQQPHFHETASTNTSFFGGDEGNSMYLQEMQDGGAYEVGVETLPVPWNGFGMELYNQFHTPPFMAAGLSSSGSGISMMRTASAASAASYMSGLSGAVHPMHPFPVNNALSLATTGYMAQSEPVHSASQQHNITNAPARSDPCHTSVNHAVDKQTARQGPSMARRASHHQLSTVPMQPSPILHSAYPMEHQGSQEWQGMRSQPMASCLSAQSSVHHEYNHDHDHELHPSLYAPLSLPRALLPDPLHLESAEPLPYQTHKRSHPGDNTEDTAPAEPVIKRPKMAAGSVNTASEDRDTASRLADVSVEPDVDADHFDISEYLQFPPARSSTPPAEQATEQGSAAENLPLSHTEDSTLGLTTTASVDSVSNAAGRNLTVSTPIHEHVEVLAPASTTVSPKDLHVHADSPDLNMEPAIDSQQFEHAHGVHGPLEPHVPLQNIEFIQAAQANLPQHLYPHLQPHLDQFGPLGRAVHVPTADPFFYPGLGPMMPVHQAHNANTHDQAHAQSQFHYPNPPLPPHLHPSSFAGSHNGIMHDYSNDHGNAPNVAGNSLAFTAGQHLPMMSTETNGSTTSARATAYPSSTANTVTGETAMTPPENNPAPLCRNGRNRGGGHRNRSGPPQKTSSRDASRQGDPRRQQEDQYMMQKHREAGWTFSKIQKSGEFSINESTLRGRYRTMTKPPEMRVRKPKWDALADALVLQFAGEQADAQNRPIEDAKIKWKVVQAQMVERGTYSYGYCTLKKRCLLLLEQAKANKERVQQPSTEDIVDEQ